MFFKCVLLKINVELFHVAYLSIIKYTDVLDGLSKGRKVREAESNDTLRRLDSEF